MSTRLPPVTNVSPPLSLQRLHLLLRSLKTASTTLSSHLLLVQSRQEDVALHTRPSATLLRNDWAGNGKGKSRAEKDEDYAAKRSTKSKGKRRTSASTVVAVAMVGGQNMNSPFGPVIGAGTRTTTTYKSRKITPSLNNASLDSTSTATTVPRLPMTLVQVKKYLSESGADAETCAKAMQVYKSFANIIECCSPSASSKSAKSRPSPSTIAQTSIMPRRRTTLVETMSQSIGWNIETAVRACLDYAEEIKDREDDEEDEMFIPDDEAGRKHRKQRNEDEDENLLIDEWYESCPTYTWRWILAQHATSIIVQALDDQFPALSHAVLLLCLDHNSPAEAFRFFPLLLSNGFTSATSSSSLASISTSYSLSTLSLPMYLSTRYFSTLESHLLASCFSSRLFFSPFLSLARIPEPNLPESLDLVLGSLLVIANVGRRMLDGIRSSSADATTIAERTEADELSAEVMERIGVEFGYVLNALARGTAGEGCGISDMGRMRIKEMREELEGIVEENDDGGVVGEIIGALLMIEMTNEGGQEMEMIVWEELLRNSIKSGTDGPAVISQELVSLTGPVIERLDGGKLEGLVQRFERARLWFLASAVIELILEIYSVSSSSPSLSSASMGRLSRDELAGWEDRLKENERRCIATSSKGTAVGVGSGWRYEDMVGGYVTITPGRIPASKSHLAVAPIRKHSLLSNLASTTSATTTPARFISTPSRHHYSGSRSEVGIPESLRGTLLPPRTIERLSTSSHRHSPRSDILDTPSFSCPRRMVEGGRRGGGLRRSMLSYSTTPSLLSFSSSASSTSTAATSNLDTPRTGLSINSDEGHIRRRLSDLSNMISSPSSDGMRIDLLSSPGVKTKDMLPRELVRPVVGVRKELKRKIESDMTRNGKQKEVRLVKVVKRKKVMIVESESESEDELMMR